MAARLVGNTALLKPIADAGRLRTGWTIRTATDALFALSSLTVYEDLVRVRGWSQRQYERRIVEMTRAIVITDPEVPVRSSD